MRQNLAAALVDLGEQQRWNWDLLPAQREFLTTLYRMSLLSGGVGSGKSTVLVARTLLLLFGVPGNLGFMGRLDGKALRASTITMLRDMLPREYVDKWNDQAGSISLLPKYGGSALLYGDFKDLNDLKNIPLGFFAIDQMEEVSEEVFLYLAARLRRRVPVLTEDTRARQYTVEGDCAASPGKRHYAVQGDAQCRMCQVVLPPFSTVRRKGQEYPDWDLICYPNYGFGVANPEGPSHWLFKYFPNLEGVGGLKSAGKPGHMAWNINTFDSLDAGFIPKDYVDHLVSIYSSVPHMYDRYLMGRWVEAEGLVYPGFTLEHHVLNASARRWDDSDLLRPDWQLYEWIDHGFSSPTAVGWVYVEQCDCGCGRPNYILVDESYTSGLAAYSTAAIIKSKRAQLELPVAATFLDSAAFAKNQTRSVAKDPHSNENVSEIYSIADQYGEHGIICLPGQKDWGSGYDRITEALSADPTHRHPITGELGAPHWYVLSHCKHFIYEVTTYKWKKKRGSIEVVDDPVDKDDHHMDGWYTFMASHPDAFPSTPPVEAKPAWDFDDDLTTGHMGL